MGFDHDHDHYHDQGTVRSRSRYSRCVMVCYEKFASRTQLSLYNKIVFSLNILWKTVQWFSRTFVELVSYRTVPKPYHTKLKLFIKNSLGTFDVSYYRTFIKNLELFLKTEIFLKKYHKIMRILRYFMVFF